MLDYSMFKTVLVKGFDKEEVLAYIQKKEEEAFAKDADFVKAIKSKDAKIEELKKRLVLKEEQKERLENEIEQKYKKYIDNYDRIGRLVFEAELKADKIVAEAQKKAERIVSDAQIIADKTASEAQDKADRLINDAEQRASIRVAEVQKEVNEKMAVGKKKYLAIQDEMNEILELMNQAQRSFMTSYKEVHRIIKTMPTSINDVDDEDMLDDGDEDLDMDYTHALLLDADMEDDFDFDSELDALEKILASDIDMTSNAKVVIDAKVDKKNDLDEVSEVKFEEEVLPGITLDGEID